jgi:ATP-dependent protease ClpP protease subunit
MIVENDGSVPCWSSIINKDSDTVDISINQEIGFWGDNSKDFNELVFSNKDKKLKVYINSPGGSVNDGVSMANALIEHGNVEIIVTGTAASIAGVVAMAGTEPPKMYNNTTLMLHPPLVQRGGNAKELAKYIEALNIMQENITNTIMRHFNGTREALTAIIDKTTYFSAKMAAEFGLATIITEPYKIKNFYNFAEFGYPEPPVDILDCYKNIEEQNIVDKIVGKIDDLLKNTNKKEPSGMSKEFENRIADLESANKASEAKFTALASENETLKAENVALKASIDAEKASKTTAEIKNFLDGLVKEGKLLPVNLEKQARKLEVLAKADPELLNAEKEILSAGPVIVDLGGEHFANNSDAPASGSASKLEAAVAAKMQANPAMNYRAAFEAVVAEKPELSEEV